MVVPFGISVGDFIAVGQLAIDIATALSDCRGAAAEYKGLIELLRSLETSLNLISNFLSSQSLGATSKIDQAFMNGLVFHAGRCHTLLNQFKVDSQKYTERLMNGRGNKAQTTFRKLKWSLYSAEDARKLEQRLTSHLEAFDRYLLAVNIQLAAQSNQRLESQIGQIVQVVQTTQLNLPRRLGYPWEADPPSSHVYLEDVLGRITILPAVLCRTFNTFHDTLKIMFSDHPGFEKVVKEEFDIIDETDGRTLFDGRVRSSYLRRNFPIQAGVNPGTRLSMSIVSVRTLNAPRHSLIRPPQTVESCPNCGFQTSGRRFRKCLNCNLAFRKSVREIYEREYQRGDDRRKPITFGQRPSDVSPHTQGNTCAESLEDRTENRVSSASRLTDIETESKFFRRVHHVDEYVLHRVSLEAWLNGDSRLPLMQAIRQGDAQRVHDLLLHTDTDPNSQSATTGPTALGLACLTKTRNQTAIVDLLIANGAAVNTMSMGCLTPLMAACYDGNEDIVDRLLSNGAEINPRDAVSTPLVAAIRANHFGLVKKLLDLGADIDWGVGGLSFLGPALARAGNLGMIEYLVERGADVCGKHGSHALYKAISWDFVDVVRHLLELGANVNAEVLGTVPIHAVMSLTMLRLLIAHGAQVNGRCSGCTALQAATKRHDWGLVRELLRLGADTHIPGNRDRALSELERAAASESIDSVPATLLSIEQYGRDVVNLAMQRGYEIAQHREHFSCHEPAFVAFSE